MLMASTLVVQAVQGQDTGASTITAARKVAAQATGLKGTERDRFLEEALTVLRQVDERFPQDEKARARAALESGRLLKRLGRLDEAIAAFEGAASFPKEDNVASDALLDLSAVHRSKKDLRAAEAALRRLLTNYTQQERDHAEAMIRLASIQRQRKEWSLAEETLRACMETHSGLWRYEIEALDDLVSIKIQNKDLAGARTALDQGTESIRSRHEKTTDESKVAIALEKMGRRARLSKNEEKSGVGGRP
jgi:tetratricopeptide (TPR) repeat protein